jgi:hypothetical protein
MDPTGGQAATAGSMTRSKHRTGRPWREAKAKMHATYGYTCHLCGHEGAGEADHLDTLAHNPGQRIDYQRLRPAHGSNYPCPVCPPRDGKPRCCNQERGTKSIDAMRAFTPAMEW